MFAHLDSLWTLLESMLARALQLLQAILDVREEAWPCGKLTLTIWSCLMDHVTGPYIQYMTAWCLTLVLFFVGFSWCINTKRHAHFNVGVKKRRWLSDMCCAMNNDHVHCGFPIRFLRHWQLLESLAPRLHNPSCNWGTPLLVIWLFSGAWCQCCFHLTVFYELVCHHCHLWKILRLQQMEELAGFGESQHLGMALSFQRISVSMLRRTFNLNKNFMAQVCSSMLKWPIVTIIIHHHPSDFFRRWIRLRNPWGLGDSRGRAEEVWSLDVGKTCWNMSGKRW